MLLDLIRDLLDPLFGLGASDRLLAFVIEAYAKWGVGLVLGGITLAIGVHARNLVAMAYRFMRDRVSHLRRQPHLYVLQAETGTYHIRGVPTSASLHRAPGYQRLLHRGKHAQRAFFVGETLTID
jgi:hypothetical protein